MDTGLRNELIRRDGGCIARFANSAVWKTRWPMLQGLPDPGPCRNAAGDIRDPHDVLNLTIEEVKTDSRMSKKAGYSRETSVVVCWGHHVFGQGSGAQWCTKHVVREAIRLYLPAANAVR